MNRNFPKKDLSSGRGNRQNGSRGSWQSDRDRNERPIRHRAICSGCNAPCEVPFKPNGRKPVFCSDCFQREEGGGDRRSFEKPERRGGLNMDQNETTKQLKLLNAKMDQILQFLVEVKDELSEEYEEEEVEDEGEVEVEDEEEEKEDEG